MLVLLKGYEFPPAHNFYRGFFSMGAPFCTVTYGGSEKSNHASLQELGTGVVYNDSHFFILYPTEVRWASADVFLDQSVQRSY